MKKDDLKRIIKPLVKECINEVLLEEGVLSNIVSEVALGMGASQQVMVESAPRQHHKPKSRRRHKTMLQQLREEKN